MRRCVEKEGREVLGLRRMDSSKGELLYMGHTLGRGGRGGGLPFLYGPSRPAEEGGGVH